MEREICGQRGFSGGFFLGGGAKKFFLGGGQIFLRGQDFRSIYMYLPHPKETLLIIMFLEHLVKGCYLAGHLVKGSCVLSVCVCVCVCVWPNVHNARFDFPPLIFTQIWCPSCENCAR